MSRRHNRTASILITLFGTIANAVLTVQVLAAWRSIKWEPESEWESSGDKWQITSVQVIWGLLTLYFASAAVVCALGLHGVFKHKSSHVRFYRDYSIADFSFCAFATALATYAAFLRPARAAVCEAFSHNPELMRDMLELGLNVENCELWLERAVFAGIAVLFVIMVIRLHFLLAVSHYYSHLSRHQHYHQRNPSAAASSSSLASTLSSRSHAMQRIFVLPSNSSGVIKYGGNSDSSIPADLENGSVEMVWAAVPRHTLPKAIQEQATEAWMSVPEDGSEGMVMAEGGRHGGHHRRHHHSHAHVNGHGHWHGRRTRSASRETTGQIKLEISPEEGLLPAYTNDDIKA